ncbi:ATP-binding protein [Planomonospora corallina]|uniref:Sensor-like histidine kinase SenX3 n=1 Tax=Planomonospora corallina TaxID=1806052 RepID=A0ABV8I7S8_9ACTN
MPAPPRSGAVLRRTTAFAALYAVAVFVGRMELVGGTAMGLVWPAAGVGAVWLLAQRHERSQWLDVLVLAVIAFVVNLLTGAPARLAVFFVTANVVQLLVFLRVFARLCPQVWEAPGRGALERVQHLWGLLAAALAGAACGALIGPTALGAFGDRWSALTAMVWLARNVTSIVAITALGLCLGRPSEYLTVRPDRAPSAWWQAPGRAPERVPGRWAAELCALVVVSAAAYAVTFGVTRDLPLTFLLIAVTVWAAVRFSTAFTALHALVTGAVALTFTLYGDGPFASVSASAGRVLVAQVFVGVAAVVGLALALGRDERETLAGQRAAAGREVAAQAGMLAAIVDSMHDGLVVVDADGRFVMSNPAARGLLGLPASATGIEDYALFQPDGAPLGRRRLPHMLALAGHEVRDMEVRVCPSGGGEERMLSVSATRLPTGEHTTVVVFHDVTAERRHRDELTAFAGVVAHDLRNPLTTIDGWAQLLADAEPAGEAAGELTEGITRIRRAAAQMRELIGDLLAHATARDAPITPVPIDLGRMVREVAAARGDLPGTAGHGQEPVFHIGELDAVRADRALVRQLLDNLIGNAVKYTAPGQRPRITVTSAIERPGWVRVEVADRGIGIPAGLHEAIFENFRRAHQGGSYTGSGLGLAICKRIAERHGGTIRAEDNPGGGSRFSFTLPAADAPAGAPENASGDVPGDAPGAAPHGGAGAGLPE